MKRLGYAALAALALWPISASAGLGERELQVAGRLLNFISGIDKTELTAAIVYSDDPGSESAANELQRLLSGGFTAGKYTLRPQMVNVNQLDRLEGADLVLLSENLANNYPAIFDATRSRNLLSISPEPACVDNAVCVMAIQAEPVVEVIVSTTAAEQSGITLAQALRMMVKER